MQLAQELEREGVDGDLVLSIPRGGVPVGAIVAEQLDLPHDVVVARKLGAPGNRELAIGAVTADGGRWLNDDLIAELGVDSDYLERVTEEEMDTARNRVERYRSGRSAEPIEGRRVLLVDDGVATGATARACLQQARESGAEWACLAVPVGPPEVVDELAGVADAVVAVDQPRSFGAVGRHYREFGQVSDEEVVEILS